MITDAQFKELKKEVQANTLCQGVGYKIKRSGTGTTLDIKAGQGGSASDDHPFKIYIDSTTTGGVTTYKMTVTAGTVNSIFPKLDNTYLWLNPTTTVTLPSTGSLKTVWLKCDITAGVVTAGTIEIKDVNPTNTSSAAYVLLGHYDEFGNPWQNIKTSLGYTPTVHIFPDANTPLIHSFYAI